MIIHPTQYNPKKYNRVFIFGCSFTNYIWPTWANILHFETNPGTTAYNYGAAGGGNLFILCQMMAANQKHTFQQGDLILTMWSTFCREDRYIGHRWEVPGNLWTQNFYDEQFLQKYACAKGYTVRDLALISAGTDFMKNSSADAFAFLSVPPDWDRQFNKIHDFDNVLDLYQDLISSYPQVMYESVKDGHGGWVNGHKYFWPDVGGTSKIFQDYHPNTKMYLKYLQDIGFNISSQTQSKVEQYSNELLTIAHHQDIRKWGEDIYKGLGNYFWKENPI